MLQTFRSFITHTTCEKLQCLTSSKCLPYLLIIWKGYLLIVLTLGRDLAEIVLNFILTYVLKIKRWWLMCNKLWKWPNCTFSLQIDKNIYSHKWGYLELSSLFFPLKSHFKGKPLERSIYNEVYPYLKPAKGEKGIHGQQLAKQTHE